MCERPLRKQVDTSRPPQPLLVDCREAAALCGVGRTLWLDLDQRGRIPQGFKLGRRKLWRVDELKSWVAAGMPNREKWATMQQVGGREYR